MQGDELKALRKQMSLSQADMATALGLTGTYIGMMERGEKPIEMRTAWLARLLQDNFERRESLRLQIDQLEKGKLQTRSNEGSGWKDATAWSLESARKTLASVERRIERILAGSI